MDNKEENYKEILLIADDDIPTTSILERVLIDLPYSKAYSASILPSEIRPYHLPIICRSCGPELEPVINYLLKNDIRYIYYIDDNFWEIGNESIIGKYYNDKVVRKVLDKVVFNADAVIVNSEVLGHYIENRNANVIYIKPYFDFGLIKGLARNNKRDDKIVLGYAGTLYRDEDFKPVEPALRRLMDEYPDTLRVEFSGYIPESLLSHPNVYHNNYDDNYLSFIKRFFSRGWDIGIAPLSDSLLNNCKTNNKYREYGACRIAGIYSNVEPYSPSVVDHKTGILVDNDSESWYLGMKYLIDNPGVCDAIRESAYADIYENYNLDNIKYIWFGIFRKYSDFMDTIQTKIPSSWLSQLVRRQIRTVHRLYVGALLAYRIGGLVYLVKRIVSKLIMTLKRQCP